MQHVLPIVLLTTSRAYQAWALPASSSVSSTPAASSAAAPIPATLTNAQQVGSSDWGTLGQATFPQWLNDQNGKPYLGAPWGDRTVQNSDATIEETVPNTNVTRQYDFTVSRGQISPDGVLRDVILINGQYPGPVIEANWGDWIEVTVHNAIIAPDEGTAMHWHGMLQRGFQWEDGTPGISQCPIAPGESYTYSFRAEIFGPMHIYGPSQIEYDIDLGAVMLSDWYHVPYFSKVSDVVGTNISEIPPFSDNGLINGRGRYDCSKPSYTDDDLLGSNLLSNITWTCVDNAPVSKFAFQSGKTHRLRLMNIGADGVQKFSIDGHTMTVIATDYVPTKPYDTDVITLGVGQRTDVIVIATGDASASYWMRSELPGGTFCGGLGGPPVTPVGPIAFTESGVPLGAGVPVGSGVPAPSGGPPIPSGAPSAKRQEPAAPVPSYPQVLAAVYYEKADATIDPTTTSTADAITTCDNDALGITEPEYEIKPTTNAYVQDLTLTLVLNATGNFEWRINDQTFRADFNDPILYDAADGVTSFPSNPEYNVYNFAENASVVLNVTNETPFWHPFHMHGHTFYVLNVGDNGTVWDGTTAGNPSNPMRRDVQIVPAGGYVAIQFEATNPGIWPFHCHVAWHLSGGLAINMMVNPDQIDDIPAGTKAQTCKAWKAYTSTTIVDQIDSGS